MLKGIEILYATYSFHIASTGVDINIMLYLGFVTGICKNFNFAKVIPSSKKPALVSSAAAVYVCAITSFWPYAWKSYQRL